MNDRLKRSAAAEKSKQQKTIRVAPKTRSQRPERMIEMEKQKKKRRQGSHGGDHRRDHPVTTIPRTRSTMTTRTATIRAAAVGARASLELTTRTTTSRLQSSATV